MKVYGPYLRKDGRKHVVVVHSDGRRQTKSYPRYLMEQHLGRELLKTETVDHINNDFTDDRLENLQLLSLVDNAKKEMSRPKRQAKLYKFTCPVCLKDSSKRLSLIKGNLKKGKSGPFCSRKCAGIGAHPSYKT